MADCEKLRARPGSSLKARARSASTISFFKAEILLKMFEMPGIAKQKRKL